MAHTKAEQIKKRLGENIRRLRKERGFSQEGFSFECELHRTYIGAIERGEQNVSIDNIVKIASALGVEAVELLQ